MTSIHGIRTARLAGCLLGLTLAIALLVVSRPTQGGEAIGAALSARAEQTGELSVTPVAPASFLSAAALRPGERVSGSFEVRNQTGRPQRVAVQVLPSDRTLDSALQLSFSASGRPLRSGDLRALRAPSGLGLVLSPGEAVRIGLAASIEPDAAAHWEAALVDLAVRLDASGVG